VITRVSDIKKGDRFCNDGRVVWEATEDAVLHSDLYVTCAIRWSDGGTGVREWEDQSLTLEIEPNKETP
jgi:hypothetical protein